MGSAVLWILTGLLSCCARPAPAPLRTTCPPPPLVDQAPSGVGQCLHTSKHARPPAWWGTWGREPAPPSGTPSARWCEPTSTARTRERRRPRHRDEGIPQRACGAAAGRPTHGAAGPAAVRPLGPRDPGQHGPALVRARADVFGGAAGIPRRRSADYVKQADAAPLQRPRPGAGPTGAMLAPGNGDIEMGARNGLGNGAPPPTAPARPAHQLPQPRAPQCTLRHGWCACGIWWSAIVASGASSALALRLSCLSLT